MLREMRFVPRIIILLVGATAAFVFLTSGDEDSHGRRLTTFASDPKTVSRKSMSIRNDLEFVHITKTGGTAIEQAAAKAGKCICVGKGRLQHAFALLGTDTVDHFFLIKKAFSGVSVTS
jgi:hypothetical protein